MKDTYQQVKVRVSGGSLAENNFTVDIERKELKI